MLGVSIQKLQLLGAMPRHVIEGFPTINWLGFYPTYEPLIAQAAYIMVVAILIFKFKNKKQAECLFFCCDVGNIRYCSITIITALILIRLMCWRFASVCKFNDERTELKEQYEWQCE